jgi:hypothetical protein
VTVALRRTIGPGAKIASHHHVPSQAISAIRLGVPILVLIRNPIDAVASWHIFTPHIRTELQLWDYALYYETLLRYRRRFLIVPFETATKDMNKVVAAINARFGMQVPKPDLDSQSIQLIFRELEGQHGHGDEILTAVERTLPRPSKVRSLLTPAIVAEIRSPQNAEALARAMAVYREFLSSIRNEEPGFAVG